MMPYEKGVGRAIVWRREEMARAGQPVVARLLAQMDVREGVREAGP